MDCPRCGIPNGDDRRFCSACGGRLTMVCRDCGTQNEPPARFCGGCGKALSSPPTAPSRPPLHDIERRQLTVMFCDLVGSTALSHELDPEDLRDLLRHYHEQTRRVIARYGGFLARYVGDGLLIYFGYPHAREDAAVRAIHSGLEIANLVRETDEPLRGGTARLAVRIGIATGLVVVDDLIRDRVAEDAEAVGETPNLAARLQALAEPNSVVAADATRELAGGVFVYADLGLQPLHGFDRPVRAWRVLRTSEAQSRFAAARSSRPTRLIGRDAELGVAARPLARRGTRHRPTRSTHGRSWHRQIAAGRVPRRPDRGRAACRGPLPMFALPLEHRTAPVHSPAGARSDPATRRRSREQSRETRSIACGRTGGEKRSDSACSPRCCPCPPWMAIRACK